MRVIERTATFKKDFRRLLRGRYKPILGRDFLELVTALANDEPLAAKHRDHALVGEWQDFRDCHVRPDLVLIYRKPDRETLQLVRLGSHGELGL